MCVMPALRSELRVEKVIFSCWHHSIYLNSSLLFLKHFSIVFCLKMILFGIPIWCRRSFHGLFKIHRFSVIRIFAPNVGIPKTLVKLIELHTNLKARMIKGYTGNCTERTKPRGTPLFINFHLCLRKAI